MNAYEPSYGANRVGLRRQQTSRKVEGSMRMSVPTASALGVPMRATTMYRPRERSGYDSNRSVRAGSRLSERATFRVREGGKEDRADDRARRSARLRRDGIRTVREAEPARRASYVREAATAHGHDFVRNNVVSRPAVFTGEEERQGVLQRIRSRRMANDEVLAPEQEPLVTTFPKTRALRPPSAPMILIMGLVVVLAALIFFGPARMYYAAWREEGILDAQYEVVAGQYEELTGEIDRLNTLEGIEEEARRRGYAYPDEEVLVVTNLKEDPSADPALVEEAVTKHEEGLPWYIHVLDVLFAYEHS